VDYNFLVRGHWHSRRWSARLERQGFVFLARGLSGAGQAVCPHPWPFEDQRQRGSAGEILRRGRQRPEQKVGAQLLRSPTEPAMVGATLTLSERT
jgi:hypothetical protein